MEAFQPWLQLVLAWVPAGSVPLMLSAVMRYWVPDNLEVIALLPGLHLRGNTGEKERVWTRLLPGNKGRTLLEVDNMKELLKEIRANCYSLTNDRMNDINVYLSRELYENYLEDESVRQLYNASMLPVCMIIGMPDIIWLWPNISHGD